ncbi:ABC transporter permease [bacterium]|nr:ABC transporter permease [bacterium]
MSTMDGGKSVAVAELVRLLATHRRLAWRMALREIRFQYVGSSIGFVWAVLHPLLMIGIYSVVFSGLLGIRVPRAEAAGGPLDYTVYLCAGLLPWFAFSDGLLRGCNAFVGNAGLLKKIQFPSLVLVASTCLVSLINLVISLSIFILLLVAFGYGVPWYAVLALPLLLLLQTLFLFGGALLAATLNVFFRDVAQLLLFITMIWFWLTPIVYVPEAIRAPSEYLALFNLNPFYHLVVLYRDVLMYHQVPAWGSLCVVGGVVVGLSALALWLFARLEGEMLDTL